MKLKVKAISTGYSHITRGLREHYSFLLLLLFLAIIIVWGFVFWEYGYKVVFQKQTKIVLQPVSIKIKKPELNAILTDLEERKAFTEQVPQKTFSNPFVEQAAGGTVATTSEPTL